MRIAPAPNLPSPPPYPIRPHVLPRNGAQGPAEKGRGGAGPVDNPAPPGDLRRRQGGTVSRRLKQAGVVSAVVFAAVQLIRLDRANPPTDVNRTIQARLGTASGVVAVL